MKIPYIIACAVAVVAAVVVIHFTQPRGNAHKKPLNNEAAMRQKIANKQTEVVSQADESPTLPGNDTASFSAKGFHAPDGRLRRVQMEPVANSSNSCSEKEEIAIYDSDEAVRAFALRNLDDTPTARKILAAALRDLSPHIRNSALERIIELEDHNNRAFGADVNALLEKEPDNTVIETALSYYSLTDSEATYSVVMNVVKRPDLSGDVLEYVGEILYKHYDMDQDSICTLLETSPSYAALDKPQMTRLKEELGEVFNAEN